jgi:hypothetical protein
MKSKTLEKATSNPDITTYILLGVMLAAIVIGGLRILMF